MGPLILGDAHLGPGRRNGELLDACLQRLVAQSPTFAIHITETPSTTPTTQAKVCGLDVVQAITAAKSLGVLRHDRARNPLRHPEVSKFVMMPQEGCWELGLSKSRCLDNSVPEFSYGQTSSCQESVIALRSGSQAHRGRRTSDPAQD